MLPATLAPDIKQQVLHYLGATFNFRERAVGGGVSSGISLGVTLTGDCWRERASARRGGRPGLPPGAKPLAGLAQAGQPFLAAHGVELAAGVLPQAAGQRSRSRPPAGRGPRSVR